MKRSRPAISLAVSASLTLGGAAPAALADAPAPNLPQTAVSVKVGQADALSKIEFDGVQPRTARREGDDLVLQFGHVAPPNLTLLRVDPPRYLSTAATRDTPQGMELRLTLTPGVQARVGRADGGTYVDLSPTAAAPAPPDQTPDRKADPVPASGVVRIAAGLKDGVLSMRFDWRTPVGAAVFRRGEAIWVVFDARASIDTGEVPAGLPQASRIDVVATRNGTALRILAPAGIAAAVSAQGSSWTVALSKAATSPPAVTMKPDAGGVSAQLAGATGVFWIDDPAAGDRIAVVTALGPAKGVLAPRRLVDADVYSSAQGLALAPLASDLSVASDGDVVRIGRPSGLALSSDGAMQAAAVATTLPRAADLPGLVEFDGWSATGQGGFLARYDALLQGASDEGVKGKGAPTTARFGFARFLVGSQLAFEAIGVLDLMARTNPDVTATPEFRGLRGAARVMAGRYKEAQADFSAPALASDPASALWRGYASARLGDNAGARQDFAAGQGVMEWVAPAWRVRFLMADAEAALAQGDLKAAQLRLETATTLRAVGPDADRLALDRARVADAQHRPDDALSLYASAQAGAYGGISAPALLYAVELQETQGRIAPDDAAKALESVRFRWRGDATELEAARALGRLDIAQGKYREALEALRSAATGSPNLQASAAVQGDLSFAFRSLFLDGGADGLPPIQALGLFFDFKDLTPVGADGDAMVRKLARRLVDVDLLDQAAALLKYQADNRLDGVAKAQVATDLALIQVMNRQPEAALDALNASRTTLLPADLQSQRRVIQARALTALGRCDDALEVLEDDRSSDAGAARAEALWKKRDWPQVGKLMEIALGERFKSPAGLDDAEQGELLRAAVAYSLAGDQAGLARLRDRYGVQAEASSQANLLKVALAGSDTVAAVGGAGDAAGFASWVQAMKARLMTSGLKV